jgi:hypothetical protein
MYCSVEADLSNYERQQDRREAEYRIERQQRILNLEAALFNGDATALIECFGDAIQLVLSAASNNDSVGQALYKALLEAAERGEEYAVKALNEVRDHFVEVVL